MIRLPYSKSIAARALALRWLSGRYCNLAYLPECDDCDVMQEGLAALDGSRSEGKVTEVSLHANGTALRLLTALAASVQGVNVTLGGTERLHKRPLDPLLDALRSNGAKITCLGEEGFAPLHIEGRGMDGGDVYIDPSQSSQYVTALMLAATVWRKGAHIHFTAPPVSRPYIDMTARMLADFGISCQVSDSGVVVEPGRFKVPCRYDIEPDMSAATFFYEGMALGLEGEIAGVPPRYRRLYAAADGSPRMLQGDAEALPLLERALAEGRVEADKSGMPDTVMALAVALCLRGVPFRFAGVEHLRLKECDRIEALSCELRKLGYILSYAGGVLSWEGERCEPCADPEIATYGDHRMAMAFAMAALRLGRIVIKDPDVVGKSFPQFWDELRLCGFSCRRSGDRMEVAKGMNPLARDNG